MPPAPGPATAARTSSRDSSVSRMAISRTTFTWPGYLADARKARTRAVSWQDGPLGIKKRNVRRLRVRTVPAPCAADDRGGADDRDRGPGGGDRGLLARDAPAGHRVTALALVEQDAQRLGVGVVRVPARVTEGSAVGHPRVHDVAQVHGRGRGHAEAVQPPRGAARRPARAPHCP